MTTSPSSLSPSEPVRQPLLPIQACLLEPYGAAPCNGYLLFELTGDLDPVLLEQALQALVAHHGALRLRFDEGRGGWSQQEGAAAAHHELLRVREASSEAAAGALCTEAKRSLDPRRGPLLRALHLSMAGHADRLLLVGHQLVVDWVSWQVLLEDLLRAYGQLAAGHRVALLARTSPFKAWTESSASPGLAAQLDFWLAQERACSPLPLLSPQPAREGQRQRLELRLGAEFSRDLLQAARQAYRLRADEVLLAALSRVLCAWSEQDGICLHLEGHGRVPLFGECEPGRRVGGCTGRYPLCLQPVADLPGSLVAIKAQLRRVADGGLAYALLRRRGELSGVAPQVLFRFRESFEDVPGGRLRLLDAGLWREADAFLEAPLCVDVELCGDALRLGLAFSPSQWQRSTLEGLLQRLQDELQSIRAHCVHAPRSRSAADRQPGTAGACRALHSAR